MSKPLCIGLVIGFALGVWFSEWANDGRLYVVLVAGHEEALDRLTSPPESRGDAAVAAEGKGE